jgi:hypothetical protein
MVRKLAKRGNGKAIKIKILKPIELQEVQDISYIG